jgi:hypothetical protein
VKIRFSSDFLELVDCRDDIDDIFVVDVARSFLLECVTGQHPVAGFVGVFVFEADSIK